MLRVGTCCVLFEGMIIIGNNNPKIVFKIYVYVIW